MEEVTLGVGLVIEIGLIIGTIVIVSSYIRKFSRKYNKYQLNEQYYKSLYEQNPDAVIIFDTEGKFISANKAVSLYGFSEDELIHKPFTEFLLPEDLSRVMGHFAKL
ncbi:PAS domain S-box protein [Neobacillus sp. YX16]|uniref:PAS domain S-box protein n=1 Tax=Neobacillus sp. YX16 TaxID=3047874 RepID=UPI0024C3A54A|nr:PAS domain S-box protein [Neobacillus sp. YX16]WHZ01116.1 PAS domain S-box protein [Neobacillus sp. YX16]